MKTKSVVDRDLRTKQKSLSTVNRNRKIFYYSMIAIPLIQFCVFYIYINFNSFLMAFQEYSWENGRYEFLGLINFQNIFKNMKEDEMILSSFMNSLELFVWTLLVGMGGSVDSTSTPTANKERLFKAFATACSSSKGPRPVLISMAEGFIQDNVSAFTK